METGYKIATFENAIKLLRPGCSFVLWGNSIKEWTHSEPPPTNEEIDVMIKRIEQWEDANPDLAEKVYV